MVSLATILYIELAMNSRFCNLIRTVTWWVCSVNKNWMVSWRKTFHFYCKDKHELTGVYVCGLSDHIMLGHLSPL